MRLTTTIAILLMMLAKTGVISAQTIKVNATSLERNDLDGSYVLADSSDNFLAGNYFSKGTFEINKPYEGKCRLQILAMGYDLLDTLLFLNNALQNLKFTLKENAKNLEGVTITALRPVFEKTDDGTRINVENTLLSKSANSNELLGRIPTVSIANNKVSVFGRGEAIIIINGKETTMESFKAIAPSDIKSIEVVNNPDAKYDAKGKVLILVTMKKYYSEGLSATLVNATTMGIIRSKKLNEYIVNAPNLTFNYRKNKWDFSGYYGNEYGTNWADNNFITTVKGGSGDFKKIGYYTENNHNKSVHYYKLGLGYKISEKASLSAQYDGLSHLFGLDVVQNGDYFLQNELLAKIRMTNDASTKQVNHSANLNYYLKTDTLGSNLFIGAQYNQFSNHLLDQITEIISNNSGSYTNNRINDGLNVIQLYTGQIDYVKKLKQGSFETGGKFSHTINAGKINFYSKNVSDIIYTENTLFANSTLYKEYVPAVYAIYKTQIKKWSGSFGTRVEHTTAKGISRKLKTTLIDAEYINLFPSAKLNYKISNKWATGVSYSYKISRPLYQDLDPFLWYLDSLTSIQGNSKLVPEFVHQSEYKLSYNQFVFRYGFNASKNRIASVMSQGYNGANSVIFIKDNIQHLYTHLLSIELPFEHKAYSSYNKIATNFYQFKDNRAQYQALKNRPEFYLYSYHSYKIPKWFSIEFTAEYYSASFNGFNRRKPYYYFTFALSRSFLKEDALNINLMWNDFARTALWGGEFNINTYGNAYNQRFTTNYIRLTLTYNLTSKTTFNYNNKNVNEAEFNRIKK